MITLEKPRWPGDWLRLYRLYLQSFPPSERKPFSIIVQMYRQGKGHVWCIRRAGKFTGMATTIQGKQETLLDYFAVKKDARGQGVGRLAMKRLLELYGDRGFFLEIESTREVCPDLMAREKRKHFYMACGLTPLDVEAEVFGVRMELLGVNCTMDFDSFKRFYREEYNLWAAEHILPISEDTQ